MSACSFTPSDEGIVASVQVAPAGTSAALAVAGSARDDGEREEQAESESHDRSNDASTASLRSCAICSRS